VIAPGDDLDRIMAVMQAAFDPAYGEAWTRRQVEDALLTGTCQYALAFSQNRCAGFFLSRTVLDEEELLLLAVDPEFGRQGIGRQLIDRLCQEARQRGVTRLFLEMRKGNPAEQLYVQSGFSPVGIRPGYYKALHGERLDAITFSLNLA
jgi:ribosomal-protein-alanine N-acetyltransferase